MFPLIAALAQAGGVIVDKIAITRRQIPSHIYIPLAFLFLFLSTAIFYPFIGKVSPNFFSPLYLILFSLVIIIGLAWNVLYYRGIQMEKVHEFELILMFQPILTILLASIVFPAERNWQVLIVAIIASIALIYSKFQKHHCAISVGSWYMIGTVALMSIELILAKPLLSVMSPVAFYFFRTGILFVVFYFFYRPRVNLISKTNYAFILASAVLGTAQMVSKFYGFEIYGVVYTSLILILGPILTYIISTIWLHERLKARTVVSALVILGCIIYATVAIN